jgi:pseudaminic acid synthase
MVMRIGDVEVGEGHPPFVIAEMSGNHAGSLERALAIVDAAADAGAHAVKLQTYTADTMTLDLADGEFVIRDPRSLWHGRTLHDLYEEAHTPWEWHRPIMDRAADRGISCFSSPFDDTAVDFLDELDVPCFKIASFECVDLPLIRRAAATGRPLIVSTGIATLDEIEEAVEAAREAGCDQLLLLKCTSSYPASPDDSNLRTIPDLRARFGCEVGLSDHTLGIGAAIAAVAVGASAIEKHVMLRREDGGVDAAFSLEPEELAALVAESDRAARALGRVRYGPTEGEATAVHHRRSLYVAEDLEAGDELTPDNLRRVRPGLGLPPKHQPQLFGRRVVTAVRRGTPMSWDLVE